LCLDGKDLRPQPLKAMRVIARTGMPPNQQIPSMCCSIKWKALKADTGGPQWSSSVVEDRRGGNNGDGDEGRDEAILDGSRTRLVFHKRANRHFIA